MENELLTKGKEFNIEIISDKNNTYSIQFTLNNSLEIVANQKNAALNKSFSNKFTIHEIQQNEYFVQFDTLNEIYDEVFERTKKDKITITENENTLIINIPLPSTKYTEKKFELKQISKNDNEKINDLTQLVIKQNKEIADLKNELKDIKEKLNILWKEREEKEKRKKNKQISNLNSKIINENEKYKKLLKTWINPLKKIKAELLYRLSENGESYSTFHELCDNKGPTLTLFHVNDGNIVGIYTPLSWDSNSNWKNDNDTFIFNLNKEQKYKKIKSDCSAYCNSTYGPYTADFGCNSSTMNSIVHYSADINSYYDNGSDILPSNNQEKYYDLLETEVYKIIIE